MYRKHVNFLFLDEPYSSAFVTYIPQYMSYIRFGVYAWKM